VIYRQWLCTVFYHINKIFNQSLKILKTCVFSSDARIRKNCWLADVQIHYQKMYFQLNQYNLIHSNMVFQVYYSVIEYRRTQCTIQ